MGTGRIIYIRTDGNSHLAAGHLVRCLSIADACYSLGMEVHFLVSDRESFSLLQDFLTGMTLKPVIQILETAVYNDLEKELSELVSLLSAHDTNVTFPKPVLLLDSYYVTETYLNAVSPVAKTAYIDDLYLFDYPIDLLINYDIVPETLSCYQKAGKTLLGAAYAPLRPQFANMDYILKKQISHLLITTGGSDPYHFCLNLAEFLTGQISSLSEKSYENPLYLDIVIGRLNTDREALAELAEQFPFIVLHENVSDMAVLMKCCDLAVSAAGTTLYELCAVGVPAISFTMAANQLTAAKSFDDAGIIPCAGDIRTSPVQVFAAVSDFITTMGKHFDKRKSAHDTMTGFIDGKGALRIAEELSLL